MNAMSPPTSFLAAFVGVLAESLGNDFEDNYDRRRFGPLPEQPPAVIPRETRLEMAQKGFVPVASVQYGFNTALNLLQPHMAGLEALYAALADQESRDLLVKLMAFRALGHRRVRLPLSTPEFEATLSALEAEMEGAETVDLGFLGWQANKIDLSKHGYPVTVFLRPMGAFTQYLAQQYRCAKDANSEDGAAIEVEPGDVVIDAGGCFGDTALYFAHKAGPEGRVFSFEFVPDNLTVFRRNMAMNPELAARVQLVESPLWSASGETIYIEGRGPATRVSPTPRTPDAQPMFTLTIDDLVAGAGLERVDFIKMDIEGAEQAALKGAEATLRAFRPKLGLSVYHRLEDFAAIYRFVDGLGLGYRFYLRHFTMHAEETILFAEPI